MLILGWWGGNGQGVEAGKDNGETHRCSQMDVSSGCPKSLEARAQRTVFWDASGPWRRLGVSMSRALPFFHSVLQRQARSPSMHMPELQACDLCPSFHIPPWSCLRLSSHTPTTLNHAHPSTSCLHPSIISGIWPLTQLPALLGAPGLAPELQSIPGLG